MQLQGLSGLQSEFKISLGDLEKTLSQSELNIRIEFSGRHLPRIWRTLDLTLVLVKGSRDR